MIDIDYDRVIRKATQMYREAGDMSKQVTTLSNIYDSTGSYWESPASRAYRNKLAALIGKMNRTSSQMSEVASDIIAVAQAIKKQDDEQARQAAKLI